MKATLRIPTTDPYAYIELHDVEGEPADIFEQYKEMTLLATGGSGLEAKEFNRVLDRYLWGDGHMTADEFGTMNLDQQTIIQTIKRSRARNKE